MSHPTQEKTAGNQRRPGTCVLLEGLIKVGERGSQITPAFSLQRPLDKWRRVRGRCKHRRLDVAYDTIRLPDGLVYRDAQGEGLALQRPLQVDRRLDIGEGGGDVLLCRQFVFLHRTVGIRIERHARLHHLQKAHEPAEKCSLLPVRIARRILQHAGAGDLRIGQLLDRQHRRLDPLVGAGSEVCRRVCTC